MMRATAWGTKSSTNVGPNRSQSLVPGSGPRPGMAVPHRITVTTQDRRRLTHAGDARGWVTATGPAQVLHGLDTTMQTLHVSLTATAFLARIDQTPIDRAHGTARVHWSAAGHPPPR